MLFNSGVFLLFLAGFLLLYYLARGNLSARNLLILAGSYLFYGWWDYRFLALLIFSSLMDYGLGRALGASQEARRRKMLVGLSVLGNLSILGFFKYYNFFVESFSAALQSLQLPFHPGSLNIILPVGISFYTFQSLGYTIDVYRRQIEPARNPVQFLAYVAFFPQLVAGPIERARHLLPQFAQTLRITRSMLEEGLWLFLWGMFKKVVVADNLAPLVEMIYGNPDPTGLGVVLGTLAFGVQIYCDFSGYSDIARGIAKWLGFEIVNNFNIPYAALNLREFWQRWHISLSTWLRDYLYISLGGNRLGTWRTCRNLFLTMLLGGLWHGAAWNFVLWGAWHGLGLILVRIWHSPSPASMNSAPAKAAGWLPGFVSWLATMMFVFFGWLLFRAESWSQIVVLVGALSDFRGPAWWEGYCLNLAAFTLPVVAVQIWQTLRKDLLAPARCSPWIRSLLQGLLLIAILIFWQRDKVPFIYFQF